jgi:4-amino-4-deoxy-L-arabinose transferase-like glycosyltransferase
MRINLFSYNSKYFPLILGLVSALFFFPLLGHVHLFDWDEINFAESSREMMISKDYFHVQINYMPFWEKPPLFMWLQSFSMQIFGDNEFGARFPNALFGIITLICIYQIGKKLIDPNFGLIWALLYLMSFLPHVYFKSGIIDPVFNFFIFMSIFFLIKTINHAQNKDAILGGIFAGLAILTKGPVGLLLILLTYLVYLIINRFKNVGTIKHIALFTLSTGLITVIWILPEIFQNGFSTLGDFIAYQIRLLTTGDAGHEQPFFYHFLVVFIGCFPMSVFAFPLFRANKFASPMNFTKWMMILFWVVMILFTIVKTKIVHYSSMCWLPLSFCAAIFIYQKFKSGIVSKTVSTIFLISGLLFSVILIGVPLAGYNRSLIIPYVKDKFAVACMQQPVDWQLWFVIWGVLFAISIVYGYILLRRNNVLKFISVQAIVTGIVLTGYLSTIVPKIEEHSQGPAIRFYESLVNKDVYVLPIGFKSYAHYYYFKVPNTKNKERQDEQFLLYGNVDKPVYYVTKINEELLDLKGDGFTLIRKEGGFKFYKRNL